jgi:hypothetical protein
MGPSLRRPRARYLRSPKHEGHSVSATTPAFMRYMRGRHKSHPRDTEGPAQLIRRPNPPVLRNETELHGSEISSKKTAAYFAKESTMTNLRFH